MNEPKRKEKVTWDLPAKQLSQIWLDWVCYLAVDHKRLTRFISGENRSDPCPHTAPAGPATKT